MPRNAAAKSAQLKLEEQNTSHGQAVAEQSQRRLFDNVEQTAFLFDLLLVVK